MAEQYKTEDGRVFDSQWAAQEHANDLADPNNEKRRNDAHAEYVKGLTTDEDRARWANDKAAKLFDQGDYDGAIASAYKSLCIKSVYSKEKSCQIIARAYVKKGEYGKSIDYFTGVISGISVHRDKNQIGVLAFSFNERGLAHKEIGNTDKAISDFKFAADCGNKSALENLKKNGVQYSPNDISNQDWRAWANEFYYQYKRTIEHVKFPEDDTSEDSFSSEGSSSSSGKGILVKIGLVLVGIFIIYKVLSFFSIIPF